MCFDFLYKFCLTIFAFWEELNEIWSKMYIGLLVKYPLFLSDYNETWIFLTFFLEKYSSTKFHKIPSSGSQLVPCRRTDGRTDIMKLIFAFRDFANAPNNTGISDGVDKSAWQRDSEYAQCNRFSLGWWLVRGSSNGQNRVCW